MLRLDVLPKYCHDSESVLRFPLSYDQALQDQAEQLRRRDRVDCVGCLTGEAKTHCRCKFVDKRGKLAKVGSSILFLPSGQAVPGRRCRVQIKGTQYQRPCQYLIREIGPSPCRRHCPNKGVWIKCASWPCSGNAFFPYGLGNLGRHTEWINVHQVARLCLPFIPSILGRIRWLRNWRASGKETHDLPSMLLDLYGVSAILGLRAACKDLARESSLRVFAKVCVYDWAQPR